MDIGRFKRPVDAVLAVSCVIIMVVLVLCVVWQVLSRYILASPSTMTDEIARFLMIWISLLGAAYTVGLQRHLSIDLLAEMLDRKNRLRVGLFINVCIFSFSLLVIFYGGFGLLNKVLSTGQVSPSLRLPIWMVYVVIPLSGGLMMYYSLLHFLSDLGSLLRKEGQISEKEEG